MLYKHLRCGFTIGIEDMLEDKVVCLIDGFGITIVQGRNVLCVDRCDDFLP